jgi:ferrochelatase
LNRRVAVVLFNLGGPDGPAAVQPFLFNLFRDPAIIGAPAAIRLPLALFISRMRAKSARANYALMGGGSPLLPETERQSAALTEVLARALPDAEVRCFIAMRYWKPLTQATAKAVAAFAPDEVILLPLYPQFSTTTTGSSVRAWASAYKGGGRVSTLCCYPDVAGLVDAHAQAIRSAYDAAGRPPGVRLLFSAHGLPERVVQAGDPYQVQVEATAAAVAKVLDGLLPWSICYQSRVGPLKWIGPSTVETIEAAGQAGEGVLIAPIAFVSEHVETLVELDHEYKELAQAAGCPIFLRAPALGVSGAFIEALAGAVIDALKRGGGVASACGGRWCDADWSACPARAA